MTTPIPTFHLTEIKGYCMAVGFNNITTFGDDPFCVYLRNPEFTPKLITVVFRTFISNGEKYKAVIYPYVTDGDVNIPFDSYTKLSQILSRLKPEEAPQKVGKKIIKYQKRT